LLILLWMIVYSIAAGVVFKNLEALPYADFCTAGRNSCVDTYLESVLDRTDTGLRHNPAIVGKTNRSVCTV
jgi:hypothetical protein